MLPPNKTAVAADSTGLPSFLKQKIYTGRSSGHVTFADTVFNVVPCAADGVVIPAIEVFGKFCPRHYQSTLGTQFSTSPGPIAE